MPDSHRRRHSAPDLTPDPAYCPCELPRYFVRSREKGRLTGTESVFVRTSGCNLRCRYCDTPYASWTPEGETFRSTKSSPGSTTCVDCSSRRSWKFCPATCQMLARRRAARGPHRRRADAVRRVDPADGRLRAAGWHITIETAGTLYLPVACDLMSISPKLSNSTPPPEPRPAVGLASHGQPARAGGDPPAGGRVRRAS